VADWLSYGIDPGKSVVFVQSHVPQHLELFMILSFITPLGWLSRCPTFKEQIKQLRDKDVNTYAFLGYPTLQTSDIILYKANCVPVGEDQLPHLELCREIIRRFHFIYKQEIFVEPEALLTPEARLLGLDGRKMSKSYNNYIALDEEDDSLYSKVLSMVTDPARIRKTDKGHPDICNVFTYYTVFKPQMKNEVYAWCTKATRGCKECKTIMAGILKEFIAPHREKKKEYLRKKDYIKDILHMGKDTASNIAEQTLQEVRKIMGL
jgi:tryptophanyl-tRNA synthetase